MGKRTNKKSDAVKARELCIMAVAVMVEEYTLIAHSLRYNRKEMSAFAEAVALLCERAGSQKHLAHLIEALDEQMAQQGVPLDKRGTQLRKRVLNGSLPEGD